MLCLDYSYFSQETGLHRSVAVECVPKESLKHSAPYTSQKCSDPHDCEPYLAACIGGRALGFRLQTETFGLNCRF